MFVFYAEVALAVGMVAALLLGAALRTETR